MIVRQAWALNSPCILHGESSHEGTLPTADSFLECNADNVVLSVLKKSEDEGNIIIRGYETHGVEAKALIKLKGFEDPFSMNFRPHEIKTIRVDRCLGKAVEVDLLENPI